MMNVSAKNHRTSLPFFNLGSVQPYHLLGWLLALLPLIFALSTWDSDGRENGPALAVRYLSLPVMIGEIIIIFWALRSKFQLYIAFLDLPKFAKYVIVLWILFAVAAVFTAGNQATIAAFTTIRYALHGIAFAAMLHLLKSSEINDPERWLMILVAGAVGYICVLAAFALAVPDKLNFPWALRMPSGTNIRQIGYYAAIIAIAPLSLLLYGKGRLASSAIALSVIIIFVSWTGSRGALAGLVLGAIAAALLIWRRPAIMRCTLALALLSASALASIWLPTPGPEFGLARMVSSTQADDISTGRYAVWENTVDEIIGKPFIGHGSGTFNQNMKSEYGFDYNHPHQIFLQYAYDWGVIGGLVGIVILMILFHSTWRLARPRIDAAGYAAIASFTVTGCVALIDGALFYPLSIVLALSLIVPCFTFVTKTEQI